MRLRGNAVFIDHERGRVAIGSGTKIWHFSKLLGPCSVGQDCSIGQNCVIERDVVIGNRVKIQNNVSVYSGVTIEDDAFCGPSMVFTNIKTPRSHYPRKDAYIPTLVKRGASIGANATIICGVTLGEYSMVGAGAVVTADVAPYSLVLGSPAVHVGFVCYCGERLELVSGGADCGECGRKYQLNETGDGIQPIEETS